MKKVLLALDSFKGSLDAMQVCQIISEALGDDFELYACPMADGGEGTVDAIINARNGKYISVEVQNHIGRKINATYGIFDNTAVIEAASACGLNLVLPEERDIMRSNSYGLGEMILAAIDEGAESFILAIGGTGTNDGGYGLAKAIGYRFLDENGFDLPSSPDSLCHLSRIIPPQNDIRRFDFTIACDVKNKLCGDQGASFVYGRQKGGTNEQLQHLDKCLRILAEVIERDLGINVLDLEGGGAGGGLASGLFAFCGGKLKNGYSIVSEMTQIEELIKKVDVVVTGEGKTDEQTLFGKLPYGITKTAKKYNKLVALVSGLVTKDGEDGMQAIGCDAVFPCVNEGVALDDAIRNARPNLLNAANKLKAWLETL